MIGAVDIGGTKIAVGMIDRHGKVLARLECSTEADRGYPDALRRIVEMLRATAQTANTKTSGIGIGSTGPVYPLTGEIGEVNFFPHWKGENQPLGPDSLLSMGKEVDLADLAGPDTPSGRSNAGGFCCRRWLVASQRCAAAHPDNPRSASVEHSRRARTCHGGQCIPTAILVPPMSTAPMQNGFSYSLFLVFAFRLLPLEHFSLVSSDIDLECGAAIWSGVAPCGVSLAMEWSLPAPVMVTVCGAENMMVTTISVGSTAAGEEL